MAMQRSILYVRLFHGEAFLNYKSSKNKRVLSNEGTSERAFLVFCSVTRRPLFLCRVVYTLRELSHGEESHIVRENKVRRVIENLIDLQSFTEITIGNVRSLVEIVLTNFQDQPVFFPAKRLISRATILWKSIDAKSY
ncbi:hypothetical protein Peur_041374 [Populus x canadensis]